MRFLLLFLLLALPAGADPAAEGVQATLAAQTAAWNRGDLAAFMQGYLNSPNMTYTAGGQIIRGYADLEERYRKRYGSNMAEMGQLQFADLEVQALDPGHALVVGRWILERAGKPTLDGVFSLVMQKADDGAWRILHDHSSLRQAE